MINDLQTNRMKEVSEEVNQKDELIRNLVASNEKLVEKQVEISKVKIELYREK